MESGLIDAPGLSKENDYDQWQLPEFESMELFPRQHNVALIIPVLNEGERIRSQIARISKASFPVDTVIADGGSTDGSIDLSYLKSFGTNALLVKKGPGKLSAQLRMAYAWAIKRGYEGIITIDGNGKDGVEAMTEMVKKLADGFDYVQGSRYLPGGNAVNTPIERTLANRLLHAPVLSLAARRWYTDTTNGFRAYSVRYLTDKRVQPFRKVFSEYELLFYLTVRASQTGMRITDVPVSRTYPPDGHVPTKIRGFMGQWKVLRQTFAAAFGSYNP